MSQIKVIPLSSLREHFTNKKVRMYVRGAFVVSFAVR